MKKRLLALAAFLALTLAGCGQSAQPQQEEDHPHRQLPEGTARFCRPHSSWAKTGLRAG